VEDAGQVDIDDAPPFVEREVVDREEVARAGIVVEQREAAEAPIGVAHRRVECVEVGDVDGVGEPVDLGGDGFGPVTVEVEHCDPSPLLGHAPASRRPDPRSAAGHDRRLPVEKSHVGYPRVLTRGG
jgi:hypothetical protein